METPSAPPTTIVVVEDNPLVSSLITYVLERRGYTVIPATDGQQAMHLVETIAPPRAVLLDVMLPYVDGFELIDRIRQSGGWAEVPILMLTSLSQESSVVRALEAGANDYIIKPFRPNELVARVRRILREQAA